MQDNTDEHSTLNTVDNKNLIKQNLLYEASVSQSSTDSAFQLNRLLNFTVAQKNEAEQADQASSKTQMLNFTVPPQGEEIGMYMQNKKQRPVRDPLSHRIIEKRRRDRMNNCLADLSQLIPSPYLKQGQGRIEKTEIIEMAIKHIKHLQTRLNVLGNDTPKTCCQEKFCQGYEECRDNIMRYLMESLGFQPTESQNMYKYLENQLEKRKPTLPAICTCTGPGPPAPPLGGSLSTTDTTQHLEIQTTLSDPMQPFPSPATTAEQHAAAVESSSVVLPSPSYSTVSATAASKNWVNNATTTEQSPATTTSIGQQQHLVERQHSAGAGGEQYGVAAMQQQPRERLTSAPAVCERNTAVPPHAALNDSRDSVLQSPAKSDTSVTPLVGDEHYGGTTWSQNSYDDSGMQSNMSSYTESNHTESSRSNKDIESKNGGYKFKNDIKWRFTANNEKPKESYPDLQREEKEEFKDPLPLGNSGFGSGDSVSDFSHGNGSNGSSGNNGDRSSISTGYSSNGNSSNSSIDTSLNNTVPAFALHPMGVYYIPLVLPVSQVKPFMKNHRSMGICHPISIPVSFTGPFHMGVPQVNSALNKGLGSGYSRDKVHHHGRHSRHGNASRRSHGDGNNRMFSPRREVQDMQ